jgi:hypothetical protein
MFALRNLSKYINLRGASLFFARLGATFCHTLRTKGKQGDALMGDVCGERRVKRISLKDENKFYYHGNFNDCTRRAIYGADHDASDRHSEKLTTWGRGKLSYGSQDQENQRYVNLNWLELMEVKIFYFISSKLINYNCNFVFIYVLQSYRNFHRQGELIERWICFLNILKLRVMGPNL